MVIIKLLFALFMLTIVMAEKIDDSEDEDNKSNNKKFSPTNVPDIERPWATVTAYWADYMFVCQHCGILKKMPRVLNTKDAGISEVIVNSSVVVTGKLTSKVAITHKPNASDLKWPLGIVPYYIDTKSYDKIISQRIRSAMKTIESSSCVVFRPFKQEPDNAEDAWLYFTNPTMERECVHEPTFTENGTIVVVLGYECLRRRDVLHTVLHALGFTDETSHPQRDHYVRILWENLQPKYRPLFRIRVNEVPHKTLVEYDPMSVMHFHDRAFSTNGGATIAPLIPGLMINPSDNLSQLDIMKLRLYFGAECNKRKVGDLLDTCKKIIYELPNKEIHENKNFYKTIDDVTKDKGGELTKEKNEDGPEIINDSDEETVK